RDLYEDVGGITTLQALELLGTDPATERIVLISKPASAAVAQRVLETAARVGKPIVACLLGAELDPSRGVEIASNLYHAARLAAPNGNWVDLDFNSLPRVRRQSGQDQIRGLYCGGTLCEEAERAIGAANGHEL